MITNKRLLKIISKECEHSPKHEITVDLNVIINDDFVLQDELINSDSEAQFFYEEQDSLTVLTFSPEEFLGENEKSMRAFYIRSLYGNYDYEPKTLERMGNAELIKGYLSNHFNDPMATRIVEILTKREAVLAYFSNRAAPEVCSYKLDDRASIEDAKMCVLDFYLSHHKFWSEYNELN